jgi:putative acetyltransferase
MTEPVEIREGAPADLAAIEALYPQVFPNEDLLPLVRELLQAPSGVLALAGFKGGSLVAHGVFTLCGITESRAKAALLGPLAVAPAWQRQGIGGALVRAGLRRLEHAGVEGICVLGDPGYYRRLGFLPEGRVLPPYPLPAEWRGAWQSRSLGSAEGRLQGKLAVPAPWLRPALWQP